MNRVLLVLALCVALAGCAKKAAVAPVPGSINALDAWSYRIISDSAASIHSVKIWEQCTEAGFPPSLMVDLAVEPCDSKAGNFPMQFKPQLNLAITSLNTAAAAGKLYHSGASSDTAGLTAAVTELTNAVTQLVTALGSAKTTSRYTQSPNVITAWSPHSYIGENRRVCFKTSMGYICPAEPTGGHS